MAGFPFLLCEHQFEAGLPIILHVRSSESKLPWGVLPCHRVVVSHPKMKRLSEALRYLAITLSRLDDFSNACSAYEKDQTTVTAFRVMRTCEYVSNWSYSATFTTGHDSLTSQNCSVV